MANADLRDWLAQLDAAGILQRVSGAGCAEEIGGIVDIYQRKTGRPTLLFDDIPGYPKGYRVAANILMGTKQIALTFGKKAQKVIDANVKLLDAGHAWAEANLDFKYRIPATKPTVPQVVLNGNTALALGVLASGMEICAMYPITPATSASHYLSDVFEKVGKEQGIVG